MLGKATAGMVDDPRRLERLQRLLEGHPGNHRIYLKVEEEDQATLLSTDGRLRVAVTEELLDELARLLGPRAVGFQLVPGDGRRPRRRWSENRSAAAG